MQSEPIQSRKEPINEYDFMKVCREGSAEKLSDLIREVETGSTKLKLDCKDGVGLVSAVSGGHIECVSMLLNYIKNNPGTFTTVSKKELLLASCMKDSVDMIKLLMDCRLFDLTFRPQETNSPPPYLSDIISNSVLNEHIQMLRYMTQEAPDGRTLPLNTGNHMMLSYACMYNKDKVIEFIIQESGFYTHEIISKNLVNRHLFGKIEEKEARLHELVNFREENTGLKAALQTAIHPVSMNKKTSLAL